MPPRISTSRLPQPHTCQCFRTRPRGAPSVRQFHVSIHHGTRLRRDMWTWLNGPGKAFRKPLPGSTNYLGAYDKQGNLARIKRAEGKEEVESQAPAALEDETSAARRDFEDKELTEEDRETRASQREIARATREADIEDHEARGGIPKERQADLRPYPLNQQFRSQSVLSEELREQIYVLVEQQKHDLASVAAAFSIDIRRVAAVVRLKTIEKQWEREGKPLAKPYSEAVLKMLPITQFKPKTRNPITPHEPINDLPVHAHTRQQIFYPTSESRSFTRKDAAAVFDHNLLPADKRIPLPMLVDLEKWKLEGLDRQERRTRQLDKDRQAQLEEQKKEEKTKAWEERTQRVVPGRRWDFKFQDISAEKVGRDGRGRDAVGYRYGMPHEDRKRGIVKIPTSVE